jgi:thioredoxin 1
VGILAETQLIKGAEELSEVLKNPGQHIALVYATWCPFCMRFLPVFQKYAKDDGRLLLVEDNEEEVADRYGVDIVPTVLVFENGAVTKRLDGIPGLGLSEAELIQFLKI